MHLIDGVMVLGVGMRKVGKVDVRGVGGGGGGKSGRSGNVRESGRTQSAKSMAVLSAADFTLVQSCLNPRPGLSILPVASQDC